MDVARRHAPDPSALLDEAERAAGGVAGEQDPAQEAQVVDHGHGRRVDVEGGSGQAGHA